MKKKLVPIVLLSLIIAGIVIYQIARRGDFLYAGTIEATEIVLSSRLSAVIGAISFNEGDKVKSGDTLVKLSVDDIYVAYEAAERDFKRAKELLEAGSMNQENFDRIKFKRDDAAVKVSWATIKAPVEGTVIMKFHEPGEMVTPGTKLLTLADLSKVWAYVYVPQPVLSKISLGMEVNGIIAEVKGRKLPGKIIYIKSEAEFTPRNVQTRKERTRLVYGVKVEFENPDGFLKPGMTIEVKLPK